MAMEEFHGPHVKPLKEAYVAIDWSGPIARCKSVRVHCGVLEQRLAR